MKAGQKELQKLIEGNRRFAVGEGGMTTSMANFQRGVNLEGQKPFAIILGCSDSRVPVEMIFDQGLGDLFVIRVAGNIIAPSIIGSVEFAVGQFNVPLVVVLGHSQCGAVCATIEELHRPSEQQSVNIREIVERIRPSVEPFRETELWQQTDRLMEVGIRANVSTSANHLRHGSGILESYIAQDKLLIVGAEYSLETGLVEFFDGAPMHQ